ncbi:hypothetical protein DPMN_010509 [Dreissena polymorpha]|uniref:Uncharacterized protein n=1 Tax=Dreissena polymorpha TaxID=45954 RepID=A0A9D4RZ59_DREPO|nr:hypothetical protein DPMN_010509 [Dreissena polymorpha]
MSIFRNLNAKCDGKTDGQSDHYMPCYRGHKNAPPLGSHVFLVKVTIFELIQDIIGTNLLSKFHEDRKINVASRVLATKNAPPLGSHVFQANTNLLTKFHEDWTINMASRELTRQNVEAAQCKTDKRRSQKLTISTSHETNVLSKFHENWAKNVTFTVFTCFNYIHIEKNAPPTGGHVFSPILTIFKLVRDINKTNVLTNFHDDWAKIPNRENCHYIHIEKNAPPTGGHVFSQISIIFELVRDIN